MRLALALLAVACTSAPGDSTGAGDSADPGDSGDPSHRDPARYFPDGAPWYTDVSDAPVDPDNDALIGALQDRNWGNDKFQIDWSIDVLTADATTERVEFTPSKDFYSPDCDAVPMPLPEGGNVEGESGYACTGGGDCHLLVRDDEAAQLFEMWRANVKGDTFYGGCLAVWDMDRLYGADGRGDQCTSADAAGYPIAPLLFTADEVAAGEIDHAIRFILPNDRIRDGEFFHPATHATNAEGGGADALPYGARLRLKPDFDASRIADPDALVVVRALQKYGMFLADGGNIPLTAQNDAHSVHKWDEVFAEDGSHSLFGIEPQHFEVLELDAPGVPLTFECERNPM